MHGAPFDAVVVTGAGLVFQVGCVVHLVAALASPVECTCQPREHAPEDRL